MRHVIVTRFSVPRLEAESAARHAEPEWLDQRLALWREWYVPSVTPLEVPAILLCSTQSADHVASRVRDVPWATVEVQDDWRGGWRGAPDQVVTRLDSDDAVRRDWLAALSAAVVAEVATQGTDEFVAFTTALAIAVGVLALVAGLLRLGFLANFISEPVLKGFIIGLALTIIAGQLPKLFGVEKTEGNFFEQIWGLLGDLGDTNGWTLLVGLVSLAIVVAFGASPR